MTKLGQGTTPGPWRVRNGSVYANRGYAPIRLASMDRSGPNKATPTECDANARLIAKAPLLVEARDTIQALADMLAYVVKVRGGVDGVDAEINEARALLTKLEAE